MTTKTVNEVKVETTLFEEVSINENLLMRDVFLIKAILKSDNDKKLSLAKALENLSSQIPDEPEFEQANILTCASAIYWVLGDLAKATELINESAQLDQRGNLTELIHTAISFGVPVQVFIDSLVDAMPKVEKDLKEN